MIPNVLTIAGSDSGGGAGIQADLKTFTTLGVYGCSVVTALTAQNTVGVQGAMSVPPEFVRAQFDSVGTDIRVAAAKTGMLGTGAVVETVAEGLHRYRIETVIVDPVVRSSTGGALLDPPGIDTLIRQLLPLATVLTPNLAEVGALLGGPPPADVKEMKAAAERLRTLGGRWVLVKGGHLGSRASSVDILFDGQRFWELEVARVPVARTHGTGCTLSAAIAAYLALGDQVPEACAKAQRFVAAAIDAGRALTVGRGVSPVFPR